ncbi:MAG: methyltransferase, partial [Verrucomicrobiales bacterium]
ALVKAVENLPQRRAVRVLEVGAGTGSLTSQILPAFPSDRTEYFFTDNGPTFLQAAQERFEGDYPFVEYKMFDCEKAPELQGFEPHYFDIVLASNVIHATSDLKVTLNNLRRCLAPNGILMFLEVTWSRASLDNVFGLLPGWWRFSDTDLRKRTALLTRNQWEKLLADLEFREVTSFISSPKLEEDQQACLVARAPEPVFMTGGDLSAEGEGAASISGSNQAEVVLVTSNASRIALRLKDRLKADNLEVVEVPGTIPALEAALDRMTEEGRPVRAILHTLSLDHPRATELDLESLKQAQDSGVRFARQLVKSLAAREWPKKPRILFLTRGTMPVIPGEALPGLASAPLTGLLRVANNEQPDFIWAQIDLDPNENPFEIDDLADEICEVTREHEIGFRGNGRYVRRVQRVKPDELVSRTRNAVQKDGSVLPYRLQIDKPGILTNLSLNETFRREPDAEEIEVVVKAGGINFRDVMKALGIYPGQPVDLKWFGDDFSGTVVRVGSAVKDIKAGDHV